MMKKILRNAIRCNHCGDVIESTNRYDFVRCSCGTVLVDGGTDYLRHGCKNGIDDFTDMSEFSDDGKVVFSADCSYPKFSDN